MVKIEKINPSTLRSKGRSMLRIDTERRLFPRPKGRGLGAAERINILQIGFIIRWENYPFKSIYVLRA